MEIKQALDRWQAVHGWQALRTWVARSINALRLFICVASLAFFLYETMVTQNRITKLRLEIPKIENEISELEEEITRHRYAIEAFENPLSLMELSRKPEYRGLKHPLSSEIGVVRTPLKR